MSAAYTIAKNVIKWGVLCAAGALVIGMFGAAVTAGAFAFSPMGVWAAMQTAGAFLTGSSSFLGFGPLLVAGIGAAAGGLFGLGHGILQAKRHCDSPMCDMSLAGEREKQHERERGIDRSPSPTHDYAPLYDSMGVAVRRDHAAKLNRSSPSTAIGVH